MVLHETVLAASRSGRGDASGGLDVTIYGCDPDEARLFREIAPRFGIRAVITHAAVSDATIGLAAGNRCISVGHKSPITDAHLRSLSRAGVEYVSTRSIGYNHLDVDYARSLGITVENTPYSPDSVADYTLMLMLMAVRQAKASVLRAEVHDYRLNAVRGRELRDLTVGVIGTGRIGTAVIDRLRGFGGRILAYDVRPKTSAAYVPLDELLRESDVITLHAPLDATTRHILDRSRFAGVKPGAYVINTGRGGLVDTAALVGALESGRLSGAALDVLEEEDGIFYADLTPGPPRNELLMRLHALPNVIITPHTAYFTDHALQDTVVNSLARCLRFGRTVAS